jgi:hypothetical protein
MNTEDRRVKITEGQKLTELNCIKKENAPQVLICNNAYFTGISICDGRNSIRLFDSEAIGLRDILIELYPKEEK